MYLPTSPARDGHDTSSIFMQSPAGLISVLFLLDRLNYQGWRTQPALLFTHSKEEGKTNEFMTFSR